MAAGKGRKPVVIEGLVCDDPATMVWEDGERDRWWSRAAALDHGREEPGWPLAATSADRLSDLTPPQVSWLFTQGPEASARALLSTTMPHRNRQRLDLVRVAVARFELDALPLALTEAGESADRLGLVMLPFRAPEAAILISGWLRHLGSARLWARLWLERHAEAAARALIPIAVGRPGKARQNAEQALVHLAAIGRGPIITTTALGYGGSTRDAVSGMIGELSPVPSPVLNWLEARPALIEVLSGSCLDDPPEPAPGDAVLGVAVESSAAAQPFVRALPADLGPGHAEFGRALLDEWVADGMPAARAWVVLAQAHVGDDATMDQLAPLVRSWPARSRWARAIDGLAVLASAGTDVALRHLLAIESGMSGGPTNDRASAYLGQAAAKRGLSVTQLADRLAVTHGLENGVTLDYGSRVFSVVVAESFGVSVRGADGRVLARPPKPGARDINPTAYPDFLRFKKDLRATVGAEIARFEREMIAHRLRPARDLASVLLPHPILGRIARRLLWGSYSAGSSSGGLVRVLRIAEDGSFADVDDRAADVDDDELLGIVHPAELGSSLESWAQTFADYEILQPFPQVHRPAVTLTAAERAATSLPGFGPIPTDRIVSMLNGRWASYPAGGVHTQLTRSLGNGLALVVEISPGVTMSYNTVAEQHITEIWCDDAGSDHWQLTRHIPLSTCDPATLSELLVELRALK
ncbi:hypothetical protein FB565_006467 [Actinoplanes lutulentus]|uniref:Uncharacterized protein DUF4132 n=1 Tax=Actinoplanes lutulentus TaxID=1287878 RepID=A0A327Z9J5_9ACTN|nr:DUF4132 domain-containing protein [Actinoplanes lutulentus]MBB2946699.1 hypothetical protein [Actinoplanes lutulentus]RAK35592.1 uncharacterized protein DUF4132 [Actinoplanes lutulentus]